MTVYRPSRAGALAALALLAGAVAAGVLPVLRLGMLQGGAGAAWPGLDPYVVRVLGFTLLQAGLSTALSVALGLPLGRALARQAAFPGRALLVRLLNLPLALPAIVAVIGIVEVYGAKGWLGGVFDIYGLQGILLAHLFFNVPLVARLVLAELERIPPESFKLAGQLGLGPTALWRIVEWPQVRPGLPGAALLVFLLCAASFTVVLTLGGGPRATTLEVAIFQALRSDFDPQRAAVLALVQLVLCASLALLAQAAGGFTPMAPVLRLASHRRDGATVPARLLDGAVIAAALALLLPPLAALAVAGASRIEASAVLLRALATSLALGAGSAVLASVLVWPLAMLAVRGPRWRRVTALAVLASWIVPPAVLATGWFVSLMAQSGTPGLAAALVMLLNAMMSIPFAAQAIQPALARSAAAHDRLCLSLGLSGWNRFRRVELPATRRALGLGLLMALILSLGDLTAIALFGTGDMVTLPALIYRQMGSYRFDAAIGTALVLGLLVLALSGLAERWSRAA